MAGFFARLKQGLTKTRSQMTTQIESLTASGVPINEDFYEELTDILLLSDAGIAATEVIIDNEEVFTKGSLSSLMQRTERAFARAFP